MPTKTYQLNDDQTEKAKHLPDILRAKGYEVWYAPDVIVYHYSSQSYGKMFKNNQNQIYQHLPKLVDKWFAEIDNDDWKELDVPPHNPHVAIGIPLSESSGWRFDEMVNMIKGFHYWKANMTLIISLTDSGPTFKKKVYDWCTLNKHFFKEIKISGKVVNFEDKMKSVYHNREQIRQGFLSTDAQYLFFIDSDVAMERTTLRTLIDICEHQGADIAAVPYLYKNEDRPRPMLFKKVLPTADYRSKTFKEKTEISSDWIERNIGLGNFAFAKELMDGGVHEAGATGMGCTLIKRKCLEQIPFKPKETYGTEDLSWFAEAADKGFILKVDTGGKVYHLDQGGYVYCWWQFPVRDKQHVWEVQPTKREHANGAYYR
jgi:GT2 family glycosyltransferase